MTGLGNQAAGAFMAPLCSKGTVIDGVRAQFEPCARTGMVAITGKPDFGGAGYLFTPSRMFADYGVFEVSRHVGGVQAMMMKAVSPAIRSFVRLSGLDNHVQLNAWGVSTQITHMSRDQLEEAVAYYQARFPGKGVLVRSITKEINPDLWDMGWRLPSRQVWLWEEAPSRKKRPDFWKDQKLMKQACWSWVEGKDWDEGMFARAAAYYRALYVDKYTPINPIYTAAGLKAYRDAGLARFWMLSHEGQEVGFLGMMGTDKWVTTPFIGVRKGYEETGAFRCLVARSFLYAMETERGLHLSAGAARFKELRGARPVLEASLVFGERGFGRVGVPLLSKGLEGLAPALMRTRY